MKDSNPKATFSYVLQDLSRFELAFLDLKEPQPLDFAAPNILYPVLPIFGRLYKGTILTNGHYDKAKANAVIASGEADVVGFGRLFIANPDLPKRLELDAPLNAPDSKTFYGHDEKGYTDYPFSKIS